MLSHSLTPAKGETDHGDETDPSEAWFATKSESAAKAEEAVVPVGAGGFPFGGSCVDPVAIVYRVSLPGASVCAVSSFVCVCAVL